MRSITQDPGHLSWGMREILPVAGDDPNLRPPSRHLGDLLDNYERALILTALASAGGNQRRAAAHLSVLPSTLSEKMKRLGLRPAGPRRLVTGLESVGNSRAGSATEAR